MPEHKTVKTAERLQLFPYNSAIPETLPDETTEKVFMIMMMMMMIMVVMMMMMMMIMVMMMITTTSTFVLLPSFPKSHFIRSTAYTVEWKDNH
jgi:hypothetical protein